MPGGELRRSDLSGESLRLFEAWRGLGYSEADALHNVALEESFRRLGMTDSAARLAARGRDAGPPAGSGVDTALRESFAALGLSGRALDVAVEGRNPVRRPAVAEPPASGSPGVGDSLLALRFRAVEEAGRLMAEADQPGLSDPGRGELLEAAVKLLEAALHTGKPGQAQRPVAKPAAARPARRRLIETGEIVRRLS